jgi:hypothetical protein
MSSAVRATAVHGMFSTRVVSAGVRVTERWTLMPRCVRIDRPATVTSIRTPPAGLSLCSAAADRWERTAPGPHARTAAIQCPSRLSSSRGTSE